MNTYLVTYYVAVKVPAKNPDDAINLANQQYDEKMAEDGQQIRARKIRNPHNDFQNTTSNRPKGRIHGLT